MLSKEDKLTKGFASKSREIYQHRYPDKVLVRFSSPISTCLPILKISLGKIIHNVATHQNGSNHETFTRYKARLLDYQNSDTLFDDIITRMYCHVETDK